MIRRDQPGAPFPIGPQREDVVVASVGDYDAQNGIKIVLQGSLMVFLGAFDGSTIEMGVEVTDVLDAIQKHSREHES
jgi:hypothetical protein